MIILIPGNPIPKARHRSFIRGGKIGQYDPKKNFADNVRKYLISFLGGNVNFIWKNTDPLHVTMKFYLQAPKSTPRKKQQQMDGDKFPHFKLPDLDNLIKMYLDCSNGILFADDRQVASLSCQKFYSSAPRTVIEVSKFQPMEEVVCQNGTSKRSDLWPIL